MKAASASEPRIMAVLQVRALDSAVPFLEITSYEINLNFTALVDTAKLMLKKQRAHGRLLEHNNRLPRSISR